MMKQKSKKQWRRLLFQLLGNVTQLSMSLVKTAWTFRWFTILLGVLLYLIYQYSFVIPSLSAQPLNNEVPKGKAVFLLIKENRYGTHHSGFSSLNEELQTWKEEKGKILFRYPSMLPPSAAKVVVIYDRGLDSFESYSVPFSVSSLPYVYYFQDKEFLTINRVSGDGTVELIFNGKRLLISPQDDYPTWSYDRLQVVQTEIRNIGLIPLSTFDLYPEVKKELEKEQEKLRKK